jgi:hypothetical protein
VRNQIRKVIVLDDGGCAFSSIPEQILSTGIFGAFFMRRRPRLAALQVATLVYGMIIKIFGL